MISRIADTNVRAPNMFLGHGKVQPQRPRGTGLAGLNRAMRYPFM